MHSTVYFTHPTATRQQIIDQWVTDYMPALKQIWADELAPYVTGVVWRVEAELCPEDSWTRHGLAPQTFWGSPRIFIEADTTYSLAQIRAKLDAVQDKIKTAANSKLTADGCTVLSWHLDKFAEHNGSLIDMGAYSG